MIAAGAVAAALVPYGDRSPGIGPHRSTVLAAGVVGIAFSVGLELVPRWLVQRPQPFTEPAMVAADDAIRAQSGHSLAGSGLAALLVLNRFVAWTLAVSDVQILRWTMWIPAALGIPAALAVCLYYGHRAWKVQRSAAVPAGGKRWDPHDLVNVRFSGTVSSWVLLLRTRSGPLAAAATTAICVMP